MNTFAKNLEMRGNVTSGMDRIQDMPRCRVTRAANQTITTATHTPISFDNMVWDTDGMFDANLPTRLTCRTAGLYDAKAQVIWDVSAAGVYRFAYLVKNGVIPRIGLDFQRPAATAESSCNIATSVSLNASDYLELFCFQDSGGNLQTSNSGATTPTAELNVCLIST